MMFGENKKAEAYDYSISTQEAAESVFERIRKQKPLTPRKAALMLDIGTLDYGEHSYDKNWETSLKNAVKKAKKELIEKSKGRKIYAFGYGDHDGPFGCVMEYGGIFKNFDHFRISQH